MSFMTRYYKRGRKCFGAILYEDQLEFKGVCQDAALLIKTVFDWIQHNKEWVFSGVGVTVIFGGIALLRSFCRPATPNAPPPRDPALRISLAFGALGYDRPPSLSDQMLFFTVANPSDRPVQLTGIRLPLKNGANMVFPYLEGERQLPCMIEPGTNSKCWVKLSDVEASIRSRGYIGSVTVHAVASDALGNDYLSNPVDIG
jgi:hypothetical protein